MSPSNPKKPTRVQRGFPRARVATITLCSLIGSVVSPMPVRAEVNPATSKVQKFLVTAYYSPLPAQSAYARGTYEGELRFNGRGIEGTDHTAVYPGMAAAPESYPFGTRIDLPGMGIVTVHDRGGRIIEWEDQDIHRIDLWMGSGEEGLARALEFGARVVTGTVYPPGVDQPPESLVLASFPAPREALSSLSAGIASLLEGEDVIREDRHPRVSALQRALLDLGYFDHEITGYFGPVTAEAILAWQRDAGTSRQADRLTGDLRRLIVLHHAALRTLEDPLPPDPLTTGSAGKSVRTLQRVLKLVGGFDGEINGVYDRGLISAVYLFQRSRGIVGSAGDLGAGVFGPRTRTALLTAWRAERLDTAVPILLASLGLQVE